MQTIWQMVRYGAVGALAFAVDYGTLIFLTEVCGMYYLLSTVFAFCLGILVTYFGSMRFVFQQTSADHRTRDIVAFLLIGLVGLGLTDLILYLLTERLGIYYLLSKIVATGVVFFWNFFARKIYVVRTNPGL